MRREISTLMLFLSVVSSLAVFGSTNNVNFNKHIKSVTAITEVFPDGQKLTTVAIEYDKNIENSKLSKSAFSVEGRTITNLYTNNSAAMSSKSVDGKFVIIELSPSDKGASIFVQSGRTSTRLEAKASVTQTGDIMTTDWEKYTSTADAITNNKAVNLFLYHLLKKVCFSFKWLFPLTICKYRYLF
ncbi:MAG: hypothetical protein Q7T72_05160 [Bacteroidales bacterium]|nr:hypothetical protein [Bacteroidales bacterium]MDP3001722.1 hypothetical protein [Bacteroidales bacterium]